VKGHPIECSVTSVQEKNGKSFFIYLTKTREMLLDLEIESFL
jgi:hypothetical protein